MGSHQSDIYNIQINFSFDQKKKHFLLAVAENEEPDMFVIFIWR